jgi:hypothetical protein
MVGMVVGKTSNTLDLAFGGAVFAAASVANDLRRQPTAAADADEDEGGENEGDDEVSCLRGFQDLQ